MIKIRSEKFRTALESAIKKAGFDINNITIFDYSDQQAWGDASGYAVFSEDKQLEQRTCEFVYNWYDKYEPKTYGRSPASDTRYEVKPSYDWNEPKPSEPIPTFSVRKVQVRYYSIGD